MLRRNLNILDFFLFQLLHCSTSQFGTYTIYMFKLLDSNKPEHYIKLKP